MKGLWLCSCIGFWWHSTRTAWWCQLSANATVQGQQSLIPLCLLNGFKVFLCNHIKPPNLHQHHSHRSQYRCSRYSTSWTGYHGDSANICRVANRWHHSHHCSRLGIVSSICASLLCDKFKTNHLRAKKNKTTHEPHLLHLILGQNVQECFSFEYINPL